MNRAAPPDPAPERRNDHDRPHWPRSDLRELRHAIESGRYCTYCTTETGDLQPFEERFARMVGWQERRHPEQSRADAEAATLAYLATMPAWRDHPRVAGRG